MSATQTQSGNVPWACVTIVSTYPFPTVSIVFAPATRKVNQLQDGGLGLSFPMASQATDLASTKVLQALWEMVFILGIKLMIWCLPGRLCTAQLDPGCVLFFEACSPAWLHPRSGSLLSAGMTSVGHHALLNSFASSLCTGTHAQSRLALTVWGASTLGRSRWGGA